MSVDKDSTNEMPQTEDLGTERQMCISSGTKKCDNATSGTLVGASEMLQNEFAEVKNATSLSNVSVPPMSIKKRVESNLRSKPSINASTGKVEKKKSIEVKYNPIVDIYNYSHDTSEIFKSTSHTTVVVRKKSTGKTRRRVVDEEGFVRRVACVCVNDSESQIMLVTSKKDSTSWLVPGGGLDATELEIDAAKREAWEEAGVRGRISRRLGLFETLHPSGQKKHRTSVYVYTITAEEDDFPEAYLGRRRRWFAPNEALKILSRQRPLQSLYLKSLN